MNDAEKIRKNLLALQAELQQRLGRAQTEERHEVEEHEDTTAQLWQASEIRDGMNDEAVGELRDISRALARLDAGDYGTCENCGEPINPARLEALPYATRCIACAE
jgi:RNA polymerase-binding transcription factor DksA